MLWMNGDVELDEELFEVRWAGLPRMVQPRALQMLFHLARNRERVVPRQELLQIVWSGTYVTDASIHQAVFHARKVLGPACADSLRTVRRWGYQLRGFSPVKTARLCPGATARPELGWTTCLDGAHFSVRITPSAASPNELACCAPRR